jgi:hypothetical protein
MVSMESGGIVFALDNHLLEKDERPKEGRVLGCLPIFPNPLESLPGVLSGRAVKQVVLGGFHHSRFAYFVGGGDPP